VLVSVTKPRTGRFARIRCAFIDTKKVARLVPDMVESSYQDIELCLDIIKEKFEEFGFGLIRGQVSQRVTFFSSGRLGLGNLWNGL